MIDKEIILHIIDGPGAGWAWMFVVLIASIVIVIMIRTFNGFDKGYAEGASHARREGIDEMRATMARLTYDQQQLMKKIDHADDKIYETRS